MPSALMMLSLRQGKGEGKVRDFVSEEEYVTIPPVVIDNDQDHDPFPDVVQEAIPN